MRTTIRMSEPLASQVNELARKRRRSFTDLVEEAMIDLIRKHRSPAQKRIVLPTFGDRSRRISEQELKRAINESTSEYDLKKIGPDAAP